MHFLSVNYFYIIHYLRQTKLLNMSEPLVLFFCLHVLVHITFVMLLEHVKYAFTRIQAFS